MKDLTQGNIYKVFIFFAIPLVLSGLLSQAYGVINTMIAGKFLGEDGIAAIGSTNSFTELISSVFWGFSAGFSVFVARLFGAKDYAEMKTSIYSNCIFMAITIFAIAVSAVILIRPIFSFLKVDAGIYRDAAIYYRVYLLGLIFIIFNNTGVLIMNALGMSSYPLKMSILSTIMNICGNIFAVTVLKAGVLGIALSSVLSAVVVDICYFTKLKQSFKELNLRPAERLFDIKSVKRSFRYSLPGMFQQSALYFTSLWIAPLINGISASATAAYSVTLKIYEINAKNYQNSTKTLSTYTAQCIGAGKFDQIKKGVFVGFLQANLFLLPVLAICLIFSKEICRAFFPADYSGEAFQYTLDYVRYFLPFIVFNLVNSLFHGFYRGTGTMGILIFVTCVGAISNIIFSEIFTPLKGIYGIYLGLVLSWVTEAVITGILYFRGHWQKRLVKEIHKTSPDTVISFKTNK